MVALPLVWVWLDPLAPGMRAALGAIVGFDGLMQVARLFGKFETQALMILPAFFVARSLRWRQAGSWLAVTGIAVLADGIVVNLMKLVVRRERPPIVSDGIDATGMAAITTGKCMSFPSGDTAAAFAIACVLMAYVPRLRFWVLLAACLVGLSRVYFGCHYFSDVVAGALVGTLVGAVVLALTRRRRIVAA